MAPDERFRWLRALGRLAIDEAKIASGAIRTLILGPIRTLILVTAFLCTGVTLLVLIGQGRALSRDQLLKTIAVLVPSLVVVGWVMVPKIIAAIRGFSPRKTAKDVGAAVADGSKSLLALLAVVLPIVLLVGGAAWVIDQYRNGDFFLSTPLGTSICAGRLQETLTTLAPERDPQVEKCTRQGTSFLCFARLLDRGGIYRVAPCAVPCVTSGELTAKYYRDTGIGLDDVCTRSP